MTANCTLPYVKIRIKWKKQMLTWHTCKQEKCDYFYYDLESGQPNVVWTFDRHYCHIVAKDLAYKIICENVKIKVFAETGNIRITFEYALRLLKAIIFMLTTASIYIYVCVTIHIKFDLNWITMPRKHSVQLHSSDTTVTIKSTQKVTKSEWNCKVQ